MVFDPYDEWLQIPPDRQPPSSYALLGLPEGEADPERIHHSAAERYEHVRKYILGPYGEQAQQILTELSRAVTELTAAQREAGPERRGPGPSADAEAGTAARTAPAGGLGHEEVAVVSAWPVAGSPSGKSWPSALRDWLEEDHEPTDLYQLLGRLRFDPDREGMIADVQSGYLELSAYERHIDPRLARRAGRLKKLLAYAEEILATPDRLSVYCEVLERRLREAYLETAHQARTPWAADQLLGWLEREQWVHPYVLTNVARTLTERS